MGEEIDENLFGQALTKVLASDLLIVVGTGLMVNPVASIPDIARRNGVRIVIINSTTTAKDNLAELIINCSAGVFCKKIMKEVNRRQWRRPVTEC